MAACSIVSKLLIKFLIVTGLSWQVFQISVNYFLFDVVSIITVIDPGAIEPKAINVCFDGHEVVNSSRFRIMQKTFNVTKVSKYLKPGMETPFLFFNVKNHLSSKQKLFITLDVLELFLNKRGTIKFGMKYGIKDIICYQVMKDVDKYQMNEGNFDRITDTEEVDTSIALFGTRRVLTTRMLTTMFVTSAGQLPDQRSIAMAETEDFLFRLSSYYHESNKLPFPYTDNCMDYSGLGFRDKNHAIDECIESKCNVHNRTCATTFYITGNDYGTSIEPDQDMIKKCTDEIILDNCHHETHFNQELETGDYYREAYKVYELCPSDVSSLIVDSNPNIEDIDYVTYIFGAMGTWFGFSFLMINPVDLFFKEQIGTIVERDREGESGDIDVTDDDQSDPKRAGTESLADRRHRRLNYKLNSFLIQFNQGLNEARGSVDQIRGRITALDTKLKKQLN